MDAAQGQEVVGVGIENDCDKVSEGVRQTEWLVSIVKGSAALLLGGVSCTATRLVSCTATRLVQTVPVEFQAGSTCQGRPRSLSLCCHTLADHHMLEKEELADLHGAALHPIALVSVAAVAQVRCAHAPLAAHPVASTTECLSDDFFVLTAVNVIVVVLLCPKWKVQLRGE